MEIIFKLKIERLPEGVYLATSDEIPGLIAQGRTIDETIEIAKDVARKLYDSYIDRKEKPPFKISSDDKFEMNIAVPVGT